MTNIAGQTILLTGASRGLGAFIARALAKEKVFTEEVEIKEDPTMELYCLTKLRAETALKEIAEKYNLEWVILRPTCVYGPAVPSYTIAPLNSIKKGQPVLLEDGEGLLDIVYVDDVVRAIILAANSPQANGQIFNVGGETVTFKELYSYYGRMLQKPVRHISKKMVNVVINLAKLQNKELAKSLKWYCQLQE